MDVPRPDPSHPLRIDVPARASIEQAWQRGPSRLSRPAPYAMTSSHTAAASMSTRGLPDAMSPRRRQAVDRERLFIIWGQAPAAVLASFVVGGGTAAVIVSLTGDTSALVWYGVLAGVTALRLGLFAQLRGRVEAVERPRRHIAQFGVLAWGTAACWGALSPLYLQASAPLLFSIVILAQFGIISGALGSLGSSLPVYNGFILLIVSPMIVIQLLEGGVFGHSVTAMAIAYLIASLSFARVAYRTLLDAISLRFANEDLVAQLTEEKDVAIRAQQVAETATMARTRFLAAASHDLRQPLHAQALFVGALIAKLERPDLRYLADRISATGQSLRELLDALLDVSKLDAGAVPMRPRAFPIQALLDRIQDEFAGPASEKGLRLRTMKTSLWAHADPDIVLRILRNLVSNALRYTPRGGVVVGCRRGSPLRLQVSDTGVGIPPEAHEVIFEEFSQLQNPERDRSKGIGLGLALVRRLVDLLGTRLELVSRVGKGSVFSIHLEPAEATDATDDWLPTDGASAPHAARGFEGLRVLVVDDESEVRRAISALMETWGCEVVGAASGHEAVAALQAESEIDVVIADYRLRRRETGREVIERVRASTGAQTPAILITGDTDPSRINEARETGVPLLHKPVPPALLRRTIEEVLHGPELDPARTQGNQ